MSEMSRLSGTDKQIAWAEQIRGEAVAAMDLLTAQVEDLIATKPGSEADKAKARTALAGAREDLLSHDQAGWWIDHRACTDKGFGGVRMEAAPQYDRMVQGLFRARMQMA